MRTAIFSDKEREMVKLFLKTGEKGEGFRVLAHRARGVEKAFDDDCDLLTKFLTKLKLEI